jgi:CRP/FNR family transcriptional regulator, cyclic AMP receptor protein
LVLAAFGMKDMVNLRIVAICSNVAFIAYALALNLPPILLLHVMLLPLNGWRLAQALQCSHRELGGLALVKIINDIRQRT